ncbi:MAG: hypothetical protein DYG92_01185 [Leptolyngbya sp. PLA1]|nr:hypothetical protein [Leptolyngbya sp. PLA1]
MAIAQPSYPVHRSTGVCAASGRVLAPGEACVAVLVERDGAKGLQRIDYSLECWESGARPDSASRVFGFWRARVGAEAEPKATMMSDPELLDLFEELAGATEHKQVVFRYVLALLLVRRRSLRLMGSRPGMLLVLPKGAEGPPLEVTDPGMDEAAAGEAIEQLTQVVAPESGGA